MEVDADALLLNLETLCGCWTVLAPRLDLAQAHPSLSSTIAGQFRHQHHGRHRSTAQRGLGAPSAHHLRIRCAPSVACEPTKHQLFKPHARVHLHRCLWGRSSRPPGCSLTRSRRQCLRIREVYAERQGGRGRVVSRVSAMPITTCSRSLT